MITKAVDLPMQEYFQEIDTVKIKHVWMAVNHPDGLFLLG